nr:autophagy-related protein 11 [Quercus suber]
MSIRIYFGHSGQRLDVDTTSIGTVDSLRTWITHHADIPAQSQILLTSAGKQVRNQTLLTEKELFVFDSSRLSGQDTSSPVASLSRRDFSPGNPPDPIQNQDDLLVWQSLFRVRKSWSSGLLNGCETKARQVEQFHDEQTVIERSTGVAVASLQQHVKNAEQKYAAVLDWSEELMQEQEEHVSRWEHNLESLRNVPARVEFARFLPSSSSPTEQISQQGGTTTLHAFVDLPNTKKAASAAQSLAEGFSSRLRNIRQQLDTANEGADGLVRTLKDMVDTSQGRNRSEAAQLLEEIQLVVNKLSSDLEHVQSLPRSSQAVSQASKMALLHTRQYLPSLRDFCAEMNELAQQYRDRRDTAAQVALGHMKTLSGIESQLAALYSDIKGLDLPEDDQHAFATLAIISRLPSVYGQLLVESVRRREWVAKMRHDTGLLQEEVATYQEEEEKRRKKWMRSIEDVIGADALRSNVLGIEVSLQNEGGGWPTVNRDELQDYLTTILNIYGKGPVTDDMQQAIKDLDKPTRKQIKYAKAFKNGSMHEAAFGDTSLMLRGDEQHRGLKDINIRLEEDLRAQRSRVRKLEDLLHRQNQMSRAYTGDIFTPPTGNVSNQLLSPTGLSSGEPSRTESVRHRRMSSATQALEEKRLARRVVDLEAELQAYKQDANTRKTSDVEAQKQIEEAVLTKKDLMENMEAQQREFANERRNLEREMKEARERLEEAENDLERILGSRDDERTGLDARIMAFESEIKHLKEDAMGHAARAATEQDARALLDRKLELAETSRATAEEQVRRMQLELEQAHEAEAEPLQLLTTAFSHLSQGVDAPTGVAALAFNLEELARKSSAHVQDLEEAVAFAKSETKSLSANYERQKVEFTDKTQSYSLLEKEARVSGESLAAERAKTASLEQRLSEEQDQLQNLRNKFADGETGSEVLRRRVAEEESRAGQLSSELASTRFHVTSTEAELDRLRGQLETQRENAALASQWHEKRATRAKEVSFRLSSHVTRLNRVLERLGLAVTYQDDAMVVERASRLGASTNIAPDQSIVSPPPTRKSSTADEPVGLSTMRWADAQTSEEEAAQYETFSQQITRFNIDTFGEAVVKRVRDFEYTARKYNKEAKESIKRADAYKDRSTRLKSEVHSKIAVKDFKEGDLALFLPTRGQAKGAWAAFNIGCPHFFLAEKEGMRLGSRDFIVARITKVEQKVVDLSKTSLHAERRSIDDGMSEAPSFDDDNPFELSDGLTWWMVHATEERGPGGAPNTPGLGKTTTSSAMVDAKGSIRIKRSSKSDDASKHLNKSLDSRRSSSASKKGVAGALVPTLANAAGSPPNTANNGTPVPIDHRPRSSSGQSSRLPPAPTGIAGTASGLGIVADQQTEPEGAASEPLQQPAADPELSRPEQISRHPHLSTSPSKSVRSLQRHLLDPAAAPQHHQPPPPSHSRSNTPRKQVSPVRASPAGKKAPQAWESLFQADFTVERTSPTKNNNGKE